MSKNLLKTLMAVGLSEKAARVYLAALDLGEASILQLAARSGLMRTTIYYTIDELLAFGAIVETKRDKKTFYLPEQPKIVLKRVRENLHELEDILPALESRIHSAYPAPRTYFLYGVPGFKQIWEKIFAVSDGTFDIITPAESFLHFVREKYLLEEIIQTKRQLNIRSRQLIVDSQYAKKIIAKDAQENRVSKVLPASYRLPFTIIICRDFVAFISPRNENLLIVIESSSFAKSQRALFNALWDSRT